MSIKLGIKQRARIFFACAIVSLSACVSSKNVSYFKDVADKQSAALETAAKFTAPAIQPDDVLNINIFTLDPGTAQAVNQTGNTAVTGAAAGQSLQSTSTQGFLVDQDGEVELTLLGKIRVAGLTTTEARDLIREKASKYYKNPNVQVRFANFKVTVLGEVNKPSTYTLPNERVTLLDAIGLAGDLTIYGKRENVMVIRDNNGKKEFARVNLQSASTFDSPFYYLKQNDVVYVEPNSARVSANNAATLQVVSLVTSVLSVLILAITAFKK